LKRIVLFLITNLAILVLLSIVLSVLGLDGRSTGGLLVMAALFGMGGSFISLAMSKRMALSATGAQVIQEPVTTTERWLVDTVRRQAGEAGIGMPEVAIYESPEVNAFATGMRRDNALVAVSTGLLRNMTQDEAEAVLGHEVSHVANGDMITLALIQGVVNTFVIFLSRLAANAIDSLLRSNDEEGEGGLGFLGYMGVSLVLELVFGFLASLVVMWFSRQREFRADAGGAALAGRQKMIAALEKLRAMHEPSHLPDQMAAFGIRPREGGLAGLLLTHPPLEQRIAALRGQG
jgi:heat shock protein HtpX